MLFSEQVDNFVISAYRRGGLELGEVAVYASDHTARRWVQLLESQICLNFEPVFLTIMSLAWGLGSFFHKGTN